MVGLDGVVIPSTPTSPVRWGVVATGGIARTVTADLARHPEVHLGAVASRSVGRAEAFAAEFGFEHAYGDYAALIADESIDVVYVATPHPDHVGTARACLEAGKAVLVEKPLTTSVADTVALIDLARERGVLLMEALWTRTNPLIRRVADLVTRGELGAVRHVNAAFGFAFDGAESHRLLDPALGGGAILDLGVYPAHLAQLLLGDPARLSGAGSLAGTGVDATAAAQLEYVRTDGPPATAHLFCSLEVAPRVRLEVLCTHGDVLVDGFLRPERIEIRRGRGPDSTTSSEEIEIAGNGYGFQIDEMNRLVRAGEIESPLVPWTATLSVARTLADWEQSVRTGGRR